MLVETGGMEAGQGRGGWMLSYGAHPPEVFQEGPIRFPGDYPARSVYSRNVES